MLPIAEALKAYTHNHPFDPGSCEGETVLDQLYQAYCESHESDPPEISNGFKELESFLESLPWTITTPSLTCAAACVLPTSAKPSMTACFTVHT